MSADVLVAGIGNIFLGDDGFGVEVVRRLAAAPPPGAKIVDFGIRGFDLTYALLEPWRAAILVDATARGGTPGTLYVIEPETSSASDAQSLILETHGMNPMKVLELAHEMGGRIDCLRLVGCEPATFGSDEEPAVGLSPPVAAAIDIAVQMVRELVATLREVPHA